MTNNTSFYSTISIRFKPNTNELVHIGLFLSDGVSVRFGYSSHKLSMLSELLTKGQFHIARNTLEHLSKEFRNRSNEIEQTFSAQRWSRGAISYLNNYAQNLLIFGKPIDISVPVTDELFSLFYKKYVIEEDSETIKSSAFYDYVDTFYTNQLESRTNLDVALTSQQIPNLLLPIHIDAIGMNEIPFACEAIDFSENQTRIRSKLNAILNLYRAFNEEFDNSKMFCLFKQPDAKQKTKTDLFNNLRKSSLVQMVPEDEVSAIENYVVQHEVQPFFKE